MGQQQALCVTPQQTGVAWATVATPACPEDGALLHTLAVGLCGTDVEKLTQAKTPAGTVLGHEVVARIAALGPRVPAHLGWAVGQRVVVAHHVPCFTCHYCQQGSPSMCLTFKASNLQPGGLAPTFAVSAAHLAHTCFPLPPHLSDREGTVVEPLACVLRALERLHLHTHSPHGSSVAVIGLGFMGLLCAQSAKAQGHAVLGLDINPKRAFLAQEAGYAHVAATPQQQAFADAFLAQQPTGKVDAVVLTVLSPQTLELAQTLVRNGGQLLVLAGNASPQCQLLPSALYYREVNLITSYSPSVATLQQAYQWVCQRRLSLTPLLTHPLPVEAFDEGLAAYRSGEALKVIYHFPAAVAAEEALPSW